MARRRCQPPANKTMKTALGSPAESNAVESGGNLLRLDDLGGAISRGLSSIHCAEKREQCMNWQYDEMRQVGLDFENSGEVSEYDFKQGSNQVAEQELIGRLGIAAGHAVVDLGCGTGSFALEAARAGANVRAVDVSESMLSFVQSAASREKLDGIQTEHAGFLTFDAEPDTVDFVVSRFALHHLPDFWKQAALLRLNSALRPDGLLYLRDVAFSFEPGSYVDGVEEWIDRMSHASGFKPADFRTHVREEFSTYTWVLDGILERAGFSIIEKNYQSSEYAEYLCRPSQIST